MKINSLVFFIAVLGMSGSVMAAEIFDDIELGEGAEFRFNPCINGISSRICIIDSKIDHLNSSGGVSNCDFLDASINSCCEQLGSHLTVIDNKIDNLNPAAIESCCAELESHLDIIETKINNLGSAEVASCCAALESLILHHDTNVESCCDRIEDAIASCCAATDVSIDSCCAALESHLDIIETKINNLSPSAIESCCGAIESRLTVIESKIDGIDGGSSTNTCAATPVTQANHTVPLTEGSYCVAESITGAAAAPVISITGSNVTLDLNGHVLKAGANGNGIDVSSTSTNIVIKNGFIIGARISGTADCGIRIASGTDRNSFFISDVSIRNFSTGISASDVIGLTLDNCKCYKNIFGNAQFLSSIDLLVTNCEFYNAQTGVLFDSCVFFKMINCLINFNSLIGLDIVTSREFSIENSEMCQNGSALIAGSASGAILDFSRRGIVKNCLANFNLERGISIENNSSCIQIEGCQVNTNGSIGTSAGIRTSDSSAISIKECFACDNTANGFDIVTTTSVCLVGCTAKQNHVDGFRLESGSGFLKECIALGNFACGFNDTSSAMGATSTFFFVANSSLGNGSNPSFPAGDTNYCVGGVATPYPSITTGGTNPRYWQKNPSTVTIAALDALGTIPPMSYWTNITGPIAAS